MYIPKYYRIEDHEAIRSFITGSPFGIFVAHDGTKPIATHMPLLLREVEGREVLDGHVARSNPLWQVAPTNDEVLAIFQGPHTYISSSWYRDANVPTWNYVAIHVYGPCKVLDFPAFGEAMQYLLNHFEGARPNGRTWDRLPEEFLERQMRAIVGLRIDITRIEAAQKMSQNRTDEDFFNIVKALEASAAHEDQAVARVMRRVRPDLFEPGSHIF
ncbi:MAG: FMN-binding negative transcriptional regulator [Firmicutes bacterium]|nr:FMN-binding negative transcriptional regulator [Bacillota bacterium]